MDASHSAAVRHAGETRACQRADGNKAAIIRMQSIWKKWTVPRARVDALTRVAHKADDERGRGAPATRTAEGSTNSVECVDCCPDGSSCPQRHAHVHVRSLVETGLRRASINQQMGTFHVARCASAPQRRFSATHAQGGSTRHMRLRERYWMDPVGLYVSSSSTT